MPKPVIFTISTSLDDEASVSIATATTFRRQWMRRSSTNCSRRFRRWRWRSCPTIIRASIRPIFSPDHHAE